MNSKRCPNTLTSMQHCSLLQLEIQASFRTLDSVKVSQENNRAAMRQGLLSHLLLDSPLENANPVRIKGVI